MDLKRIVKKVLTLSDNTYKERDIAKKINDGKTHYVTGWVHNNRGDDKQFDLWVTTPKGRENDLVGLRNFIKSQLKRWRSAVLDDFMILNLQTGRIER